jgi:hypothetical protein
LTWPEGTTGGREPPLTSVLRNLRPGPHRLDRDNAEPLQLGAGEERVALVAGRNDLREHRRVRGLAVLEHQGEAVAVRIGY